jgi:hypothetical protein
MDVTRGATAAAVVLALAVVNATAGAGTSPVFTDPRGDAQAAADITRVSVGNDASGTLTFKVTAVGFASADPTAAKVTKVYVDADRNDGTGAVEQGGVEYQLAATNDAEGSGWGFYRWNGSKWVLTPQTTAMGFTRSGDNLQWTISKADLGGASGFGFYVWSSSWDTSTDSMLAEDYAPDDGMYSYTLTATTPVTPVPQTEPTPVIAEPSSTPLSATAGKRFTKE